MLLKLRGRFIYFLQVGGAIPKMQICFYKIIIRNFKIQLIMDTINQLTLFLKKRKNKKASGAIEWKCITLLSNEQEYFILILIMQETVTT